MRGGLRGRLASGWRHRPESLQSLRHWRRNRRNPFIVCDLAGTAGMTCIAAGSSHVETSQAPLKSTKVLPCNLPAPAISWRVAPSVANRPRGSAAWSKSSGSSRSSRLTGSRPGNPTTRLSVPPFASTWSRSSDSDELPRFAFRQLPGASGIRRIGARPLRRCARAWLQGVRRAVHPESCPSDSPDLRRRMPIMPHVGHRDQLNL